MASSTLTEYLPFGEPLNLVLLGKTGHGKSATGNSIFSRKIFNSRMSQTSVTDKCQLESGLVEEKMIYLVDTPGTKDTKNPDATLNEIGTAIAYRPEGFHAFLMVLRPDVRMTNEEWMSITLIKKLFGKDVLQKYTILVFTYGDTYEEDEDSHGLSLLQWLQCQGQEIVKLVDECNKRCFIINNREKDPGTMRKQVIQLISLIDRYVKENSGQMYTNDLFQFVQAELKKEEENIKQKLELIKKEEEEIKKKNDDELCKLQDELDKAKKELAARIENKHENVGAKMIPVVNASGRSCFPPDALVRLEDGKIIAMVNLKVGHKVLSSVSNAKLEYSEVYFFAHLDPWNQSQYMRLEIQSEIDARSPYLYSW